MMAESLTAVEGTGHHVGLTVLAMVIAGVLLLAWGAMAFVLTVAHEGGHALATVLLGGSVSSIKISKDTGGVTRSYLPSHGGTFLTLLSGYLGPTMFGLIGAILVLAGSPPAVLWVTLGLLVLFLLKARSFVAVIAALLMGAMVFAIARYGWPWVRDTFAISWVWILLVGAIVDIYGLKRIVQQGVGQGSDAHGLRDVAWLPVKFWVWVFQVFAYTGLAFGAALLFRM